MARDQAISVQNSFVKGFITEATGLNFPENAVTYADNVEFPNIGSVRRRPGFDFESHFEESIQDPTAKVIVTYLWSNASEEGDISFLVEQMGNIIHFYRVSFDESLSSGLHAHTINLQDYSIGGVSVASLECQFSVGNGFLFITNPKADTIRVEYHLETDTFTENQIDVFIRDYEGDPADVLDIDVRPTSDLAGLTAAHSYNLYNQGWTESLLQQWDTARTDMPSNCDVSWYFKDPDDNFDFSLVDQRVIGNSPAPRGHYLYSIYNINRDFYVPGATSRVIDSARVSTSCFFAGRMFYSGLKYPRLGSQLFFTQVIESVKERPYEGAHTVNDQTSEQLFDLLASDGGVIDLGEAGTVFKMIPLRNTLVVWASNGIWVISGSQGAGFTATDYSVTKLSSMRVLSHTSFVEVEGSVFWWTLEGIYTLQLDPSTNSLQVVCITDESIKTYFRELPGDCKALARGAYDSSEKRIMWLYCDEERGSIEFADRYRFNKILIFNLITKAFYFWETASEDVYINSIVAVHGSGGTFESNQVTSGGGVDNVVAGGDNVVVFQTRAGESITTVVKFLVTFRNISDNTWRVTFGEPYRTDLHRDWQSYNGVGESYESSCVAGFIIRGEGARKFQENYVHLFSKADRDYSWLMRGQWNYSNNPNSGKWSTSQTCTVNSDYYDYIRKRIKIRGHGIACQFQISNNGDDPFEIIGWSNAETANKWV